MKITAENYRKMYKSMVAARENREQTYLTQVLTHITFGRSGIQAQVLNKLLVASCGLH